MSSQKINLAKWATIETAFSATGQIANARPDISTQAYQARVQGNVRLAEAISFDTQVEPIQKLKSLIARGFLLEAQSLLGNLKAQPHLDDSVLTELLLEEARIAILEGNWAAGFTAASSAFSKKPSAVTRLTLLQVRAAALFELGEFPAALRDLDTAESMITLFKNGSLPIFIKTLKSKLLARVHGEKAAEIYLNEAWKWTLENNELSFDNLIVLLRAQAELKLLRGENPLQEILAHQRLAEAQGDRLFSALGVLELYYLLGKSEGLKLKLDAFASEFSRVKKLVEEKEKSAELKSTSALTLKKLEELGLEKSAAHQTLVNVKSIVLATRKVIIHVSPFQVVDSILQEKLFEAIAILSKGPVAKTDFFKTLWKMPKYIPHLHDSTLRALLSRIRKTTGLEIKTLPSGILEMPGVVVVA